MKHFSFLYAVMIGIVISVFSMGASTVQAAEAQANVTVANEEAAPAASQSADDGSSGVFLILGGMLIIIIAVVVTVVASVITTAPIADEI